MKRLYIFLLKTFLPLFFMTFGICLFIVLMQFLWKYVDDMVGKGIGIGVLAEMFFYAALSFVPMALPLAIAFGIASGVSPEKGLVTAIIGGFIVSLLGGSSVQIGGPTGAFIVIVYGIIQNFGIEGLTIATLLAGVFLLLMGLMRLGTVIRFIPYPIIVGFTSGIALTIFTTQIKDLLGLTVEHMPGDFLTKWVVYAESITTISWPAAAVGVASIAIIVLTPRVTKEVIARGVPRALSAAQREGLRERFGALTPRELDVARLIAEGMSNEEIAERLVLQPASVRRNVSRILAKLHLRDRVQIAVAWYKSAEWPESTTRSPV